MPVATSPRSPRRPGVGLRGASWDFEPAGFDGGEAEIGALGAGRRLHSAYALQAQCLRALLGGLAVIAGFLVFDRTAAEDEGGPNKAIFGYEVPSLVFKVHRLHVHIHHWLYLLLIGLAIRACKCGTRHPRAYSAAIGFCAGGFLQGLQYDDWHHVVWWDD